MTQFSPLNPRSLPTVLKNLLIINVLVFLAQSTIGENGLVNMNDLFGLHHVRSPLFQPWQIITHLFLHGSFWHLFYNMFALYMFGVILESMWGPKRFLTFYLLCGIGAALIQLVWLWFESHDLLSQFYALKLHPSPEGMRSFFDQFGLTRSPQAKALLQDYLSDPSDSKSSQQIVELISYYTNEVISEPTIGASGAVFGVLAAFVYLFPNQLLYFYFLIPIKVKWFGLLYFAVEIFSAFQNSPTDKIAHWAHLGGGLVGFLLVLTWNKNNRRIF